MTIPGRGGVEACGAALPGVPNQVFTEEDPAGPTRRRLAFGPRPLYFNEHFLFANTAF